MLALFAAILAAWGGTILRLCLGYPLLPSARPKAVPWGLGSLVIVVGLYIGLSAFSSWFVLARPPRPASAPPVAAKPADQQKDQAAKRPPPRALTPYEQLAIMSLLNVLFVPLVPLMLRISSGATLDNFGLATKGLLLNVFRGAVACLLVQPIVYSIMLPLSRYQTPTPHPILELLRDNATPFNIFLALAGAIILAPAAEELFFRALFMPWLAKELAKLAAWVGNGTRHKATTHAKVPADTFTIEDVIDVGPGAVTSSAAGAAVLDGNSEDETASATAPRPFGTADMLANILTSLFFAGLHYAQWPAPVPLFLLALVLGYVYQRTGSLWAPLTLHACFNAVSTILLVLAVQSGVKIPGKATPPPPAKAGPAAVTRMHDVTPKNILGFFRELHLSAADGKGNILFPFSA
jgi:membrane protease YdiL (CAAX protease family)